MTAVAAGWSPMLRSGDPVVHRPSSSRAKYAEYREKRRREPAGDARRDESGSTSERPKRSRSFFELFARFWALTRPHRPYIYLSLFTVTVTAAVGLLIPASTKIAIDFILTDNPGPEGIPESVRVALRLPEDRMSLLWALGGAMVGVGVFGVALGILGRWQMTRVTKRVQAHLRTITFDHASHLPLHRIHSYKSGGMASLLREDAGQAGEMLFTMVYNPWRAVIQLTGTLAILAFVDWRLLAGGLMLIPVVWVTHRTWIARIRPLYRDAKNVRQRVDATTTEAFAGMRIVRGFSRERAEASRFTIGQHLMTRIEILTWWWSRILEMAWGVLIPVASAGVLIYGGGQVMNGSLTIGDVMMFSTYLLMLLGPLETLTSSAASIQNNLASLDRVLDLMAEEREFEGIAGRVVVNRASADGRIELRDVWFTYPRSKRPPASKPAGEAPPEPVIRGVSLVAEPGQTIAFVGASGSGKTTLCNLIARFYDPTAGQVLFDGVDLRSVDVASYRSLLGIVEQDVFLFDGTIAENVAYGRRGASEAQVTAAAKAANAHAFITALENGYRTVIGERGVRLSGGQKQRIAIARAILADPLILILDEATSNLDTESELLIQQSLATLMKSRTSFVIAHRLSTIRHADRIAVVEQGRIIEFGPHDGLIARGGRYADLLKLQIEGRASETHAPIS